MQGGGCCPRASGFFRRGWVGFPGRDGVWDSRMGGGEGWGLRALGRVRPVERSGPAGRRGRGSGRSRSAALGRCPKDGRSGMGRETWVGVRQRDGPWPRGRVRGEGRATTRRGESPVGRDVCRDGRGGVGGRATGRLLVGRQERAAVRAAEGPMHRSRRYGHRGDWTCTVLRDRIGTVPAHHTLEAGMPRVTGFNGGGDGSLGVASRGTVRPDGAEQDGGARYRRSMARTRGSGGTRGPVRVTGKVRGHTDPAPTRPTAGRLDSRRARQGGNGTPAPERPHSTRHQ